MAGMSATNSLEGTSTTTGQSSEILTISCRALSARYIAEYVNVAAANFTVKELNRINGNCRIKVEMNAQLRGRFVPNSRLNAIKINNLPLTVTDGEAIGFTGSNIQATGGFGIMSPIEQIVSYFYLAAHTTKPNLKRPTQNKQVCPLRPYTIVINFSSRAGSSGPLRNRLHGSGSVIDGQPSKKLDQMHCGNPGNGGDAVPERQQVPRTVTNVASCTGRGINDLEADNAVLISFAQGVICHVPVCKEDNDEAQEGNNANASHDLVHSHWMKMMKLSQTAIPVVTDSGCFKNNVPQPNARAECAMSRSQKKKHQSVIPKRNEIFTTHTAYTYLSDKRYGNQSVWLRLPDSMYFTLSIPADQYKAQRVQWDSLSSSMESGTLHTQFKEAIGALEVRVENLARGLGEKVEDGIGHWASPEIRLRDARKMIKGVLEVSSLDYTFTIAQNSVGFFVKEGIPQLKETRREQRGEEARHALDRLITLSRKGSFGLSNASQGSQTCPSCYHCSAPARLRSHVLCRLRHFISSALASDQLPLTCLGDEARCRVPITILEIQQFLPPASFDRLLEAAFDAYIAKHPEEFKHCKTPDCT
ncbi:hypothetical protein OG21DRAFT_1521656 [Imleria badia]|nr:hypothetical protein OG21DRAFT_1521656 [Imleria badia]